VTNSLFAALTGQVAVVTGSSSGIGRAIAVEFARAGADIVVHCRTSLDAAEEIAESCRRHDRRAWVIPANLADRVEQSKFVDTVWKQTGKVDIWVNNAGADILTGGWAKRPFDDKLEILLNTDVKGTIALSRRAGERMRQQPGGGVILNIGWDQADRGMEGDSGEMFAAVKNAVMGFTRSIALTLAPDVRVNCIAPGWIRTAWGASASDAWQERVLAETPLKRWGTPEDIATMARFLCSSEASFMTGQVISVNGGAVR